MTAPEPEGRPVPYTLTAQAEELCAAWDAALEADPEELAAEAEAEFADEWDCQDSMAYQAWLEAHPEAEPEAGYLRHAVDMLSEPDPEAGP